MLLMEVSAVAELIKMFLVFRLLSGTNYIKTRMCQSIVVSFFIYTIIIAIYPNASTLIVDFMLFFIIMYGYKGKIINKAIAFFLAWLIIEMLDTMACIVVAVSLETTPFKMINEHSYEHVLICSSVIPIILFCYFIVNRRQHSKINWLEKTGAVWQYICLILSGIGLMITAGIFVMQYYYPVHYGYSSKMVAIVAISVILVFVPIFILVLNNTIIAQKEIRQSERARAYKKQSELQLKYYEETQAKNKEMRKLQHDFHHHINLLNKLASEGNWEEVQKYLKELQTTTTSNKGRSTVYTGNVIIDAAILGALNMAEKEIPVVCKGRLTQNLKIESIDLSRLISNAVENSVHACLDSANPEIVITAKFYAEFVYFEIKNTYNSEKDIDFLQNNLTSNNSSCGYGIQNMLEITEKYHGEMKYDVNEKYVVLNIMLVQSDYKS